MQHGARKNWIYSQHISWMTTAYKCDADKIGSVVSEDDILHLFEGKKTVALCHRPISGALAKSDKEALRRAYEKEQEKLLSDLMKPKPKVDWDLKKQVYKQHKPTPFELAGIGATDRMFRAFEHDNIHIDAVDGQGRTSLLIAATFDHYSTCYELLQFGANPDLSDNEGWTPLAAACRYGNISILILLLDYGADRSLRATGGPWHMDHLVVHGNACKTMIRKKSAVNSSWPPYCGIVVRNH